jgi:Xaa-Pro aminopeptidase
MKGRSTRALSSGRSSSDERVPAGDAVVPMTGDRAAPPSTQEHQRRRQRLASAIAGRNYAAAVLWSPANVTYLTGNPIAGTSAIIIYPDGSCTAVCDEYDAVNFPAAPAFSVAPYPYHSALYEQVSAQLRQRLGGERAVAIGLELTDLRLRAYETLREGVSAASWPAIDDIIADHRLIKSSGEVAEIRKAAHAVECALREAGHLLQAPTSERQLAQSIYAALIGNGSEHVASQPYIKSGPRALLTHARWGNRAIDAGDHVLLEVGAAVSRYHAALMRTRLANDPDPDYRRAVDAVRAGRDACLAKAMPGTTAHALHGAYLDALARFGAADWNRHPSGYSLGIAFPPAWGEIGLLTITLGEHRQLEPGMILHLISGVSNPPTGLPHIGLSECVLITDRGPERLIDIGGDFL